MSLRTKQPIDEVRDELGKPRAVASAARKLVLMDHFHGYACTQCLCRFPESRPPAGRTPTETRRLAKEQALREFAAHICEARGWPGDTSKHRWN
jgi:hypothetical protein